MDPTKDLAETRKLMAFVTEALAQIVDTFQQERQQALASNVPVRGRS